MIKKIILISVFFLAACEQPSSENNSDTKVATSAVVANETTITNRWYTQSQLDLGNKIYQQYCLQCHNKNAEGTLQWKKTLADGNYPPPPLNGTAHAWHHDMGTLTRTVENGGIALGGVMPGFSQKLSDAEVRAVIAYVQTFWSDEIYQSWIENGGLE